MMQQAGRTVALITACISCTSLCTPTLICPDVAYLGGSAQLICSTSSPYTTLQYTGPKGLIAPQCPANWSSCSHVDGFNGIFINTTRTNLKILKVQSKHAGLWTCKAGNTVGSASCELRVKNKGPAESNETGTSWITISVVVGALVVIIVAVIVAVCVLKRRKQQSNSDDGRTVQTSREEVEATYDTLAEPTYDAIAEPRYDTIAEPTHDAIAEPVSDQNEPWN